MKALSLTFLLALCLPGCAVELDDPDDELLDGEVIDDPDDEAEADDGLVDAELSACSSTVDGPWRDGSVLGAGQLRCNPAKPRFIDVCVQRRTSSGWATNPDRCGADIAFETDDGFLSAIGSLGCSRTGRYRTRLRIKSVPGDNLLSKRYAPDRDGRRIICP